MSLMPGDIFLGDLDLWGYCSRVKHQGILSGVQGDVALEPRWSWRTLALSPTGAINPLQLC